MPSQRKQPKPPKTYSPVREPGHRWPMQLEDETIYVVRKHIRQIDHDVLFEAEDGRLFRQGARIGTLIPFEES